MTPQEPLIHPPSLATWLVSLFAFAESEIILGDLQEEFSEFVLRVGIGSARDWYWRQALTRIIQEFEDKRSLLCYKHVVETMFAKQKRLP